MSDQPTRPGTIGRLAGEPTRLAFHRLDPAAGTLHLRAVVRGSGALDRLRGVMAMDRVEIVLPDDDRLLVTWPDRLEITTTGSGQTAFTRADLHFRLPSGVLESRDVRPSDTVVASVLDTDPDGITGAAPDGSGILTRLDRIEAKLDRLIALLERRSP